MLLPRPMLGSKWCLSILIHDSSLFISISFLINTTSKVWIRGQNSCFNFQSIGIWFTFVSKWLEGKKKVMNIRNNLSKKLWRTRPEPEMQMRILIAFSFWNPDINGWFSTTFLFPSLLFPSCHLWRKTTPQIPSRLNMVWVETSTRISRNRYKAHITPSPFVSSDIPLSNATWK